MLIWFALFDSIAFMEFYTAEEVEAFVESHSDLKICGSKVQVYKLNSRFNKWGKKAKGKTTENKSSKGIVTKALNIKHL